MTEPVVYKKFHEIINERPMPVEHEKGILISERYLSPAVRFSFNGTVDQAKTLFDWLCEMHHSEGGSNNTVLEFRPVNKTEDGEWKFAITIKHSYQTIELDPGDKYLLVKGGSSGVGPFDLVKESVIVPYYYREFIPKESIQLECGFDGSMRVYVGPEK